MIMSQTLQGRAVDVSTSQPSLSQILKSVRTHLGMEVGFISEFKDGRRVFRHVETADGARCIEVGGSDPLEESYCYWIAEGKLPQLICDPHDHPLTANFAATDALPVGAHLSVPIRLRDGSVYGTFCCFSFKPDKSLTERDLATMEAFAQVAAEQIQGSIDTNRARQVKLAKVQSILAERDVQIVYQPALKLNPPHVVFVEALARFRTKPYQPPNQWFATAAEVGLATELELLALNTALAELDQLPDRTALSINLSPEAFLSDSVKSILMTLPLDRIIVEITEHETVTNYRRLIRAIKPLRDRGLRIAVDDAGAGYSSFRHILAVAPDIIKLDMSLSRDIHADPARRALASALVTFAREIGAQLVAEGVESQAELEALSGLGVDVLQGFLLSEPVAMSTLKPLLRAPSFN